MQVENDQERYFSNGRLVEVVHPCNCKRQDNRAFHCIHNIDDFHQSLLSCSLFIYHLASGIYSNYLHMVYKDPVSAWFALKKIQNIQTKVENANVSALHTSRIFKSIFNL